MNKSYMLKVLKILDIMVAERFKIKGIEDKTYWFTKDTLNDNGYYLVFQFNNSHNKEVYDSKNMLIQLLNGTREIEKIPWKPQKGERYYYISYEIDSKLYPNEPDITYKTRETTNFELYRDYMNFKENNFFKTFKGAEREKNKLYQGKDNFFKNFYKE